MYDLVRSHDSKALRKFSDVARHQGSVACLTLKAHVIDEIGKTHREVSFYVL